MFGGMDEAAGAEAEAEGGHSRTLQSSQALGAGAELSVPGCLFWRMSWGCLPLGFCLLGRGHGAAQAVLPLQGDSGTSARCDTAALCGTARSCWGTALAFAGFTGFTAAGTLGGPQEPLSTSEICAQGCSVRCSVPPRSLQTPSRWDLNPDKPQPEKEASNASPKSVQGSQRSLRKRVNINALPFKAACQTWEVPPSPAVELVWTGWRRDEVGTRQAWVTLWSCRAPRALNWGCGLGQT